MLPLTIFGIELIIIQHRSLVLSEVSDIPWFCWMLPTYRELGLLATAILKMDGVGGLAGWRWIFVCSNNTSSDRVCCLFSMILRYWRVSPQLLQAAYPHGFFQKVSQLPRFLPRKRGHSPVIPSHFLNYIDTDFIGSQSDVFKRMTLLYWRLVRKHQALRNPWKTWRKKFMSTWNPRQRLVRSKVQKRSSNGAKLFGVCRYVLSSPPGWTIRISLGILDIQVWLTGIAYFGLVVGLYSYSLFL
jgi:hypothetical protein